MKKIICLFAALVITGAVAFALDANQMKYVLLYNADNGIGGDTTGPVTDVSVYKGNAAFAVAFGTAATAGNTNTATIKHCATTNGTFVTATNINGTAVKVQVVGAAASSLNTVACDLGRLNKYIRAEVEFNAETNGCAVWMVAPMKSE